MEIARAELGVHETPGTSATQRVVEYHKATTLPAKLATSDEVSWCSSFVCWVFEPRIGETRFGFVSTRSAMARSWCTWGAAVTEPVIGAVVVFPRGMDPRQGHVGLVAGFDATTIQVLGGNQSNSVSIKPFLRRDALTFRWPWMPEGREFGR